MSFNRTPTVGQNFWDSAPKSKETKFKYCYLPKSEHSKFQATFLFLNFWHIFICCVSKYVKTQKRAFRSNHLSIIKIFANIYNVVKETSQVLVLIQTTLL